MPVNHCAVRKSEAITEERYNLEISFNMWPVNIVVFSLLCLLSKKKKKRGDSETLHHKLLVNIMLFGYFHSALTGMRRELGPDTPAVLVT